MMMTMRMQVKMKMEMKLKLEAVLLTMQGAANALSETQPESVPGPAETAKRTAKTHWPTKQDRT